MTILQDQVKSSTYWAEKEIAKKIFTSLCLHHVHGWYVVCTHMYFSFPEFFQFQAFLSQ